MNEMRRTELLYFFVDHSPYAYLGVCKILGH